MEKISCIYTITNILNNKIYVGYTKDFNHRKYDHINQLNNNIHGNSYLQNSWNFYKKDSFIFEILEKCEEKYLASQENYWCNMLNTHNKQFGYNYRPTSPDNSSPLLEATKQKLREKALGRLHSKETKLKISLIKKGRPSSKKNTKQPFKGIYKKIYQYDLDGNFIKEWKSINVLEKSFNKTMKSVYNAMTNKKSYLNFQWRFYKKDKIKAYISKKWKYLELNEEIKTITEWCKLYKISKIIVQSRLSKGWSILNALTKPIIKSHVLVRKPVLKIDKLTGEILNKYASITEAHNDTKIAIGNICKILNNPLKTAGGYKWKNYEKETN